MTMLHPDAYAYFAKKNHISNIQVTQGVQTSFGQKFSKISQKVKKYEKLVKVCLRSKYLSSTKLPSIFRIFEIIFNLNLTCRKR